MYNLGEHFKNGQPNQLLSSSKVIFRGSQYRISVLTERLMRLEYSVDGVFNDMETVIVKNRLFTEPSFIKQEDEGILRIETKYFTLSYVKNMPFSSRSLTVSIKDKKVAWYYGNKEVRNLKSCAQSLDNCISLPKLVNGLFATDGIATIDDTYSMRFDIYSNPGIPSVSKGHVDLYLFIYDKDFGLCLQDYFHLTGYPKLIPRYALGNWWSKEYNYSDLEVLSLIEKFKLHNIPLSVFLLDNGWSKAGENVKISSVNKILRV